MIHSILSIILPVGILLALGQASASYARRPAVRARVATLGLGETITRNVRIARLSVAVQTGFITAYLGLYLTGVLTPAGWLTGEALAIVILTVNVFVLAHWLRLKRAYSKLGPLAYLAEIRHAFGQPDISVHTRPSA